MRRERRLLANSPLFFASFVHYYSRMGGSLNDDWMQPHTDEDEQTLGPFWVKIARLTWPAYGALVATLLAWALAA